MLLKDIRKELEEEGLLKLSNYRHNRTVTLENWIRKFINELNYKKDTLTLDGEVDTPAGKRRSIGDIYRIAKTYFPAITFKELCVTLFSIRTEFNDSFCYTIHKHVFYRINDGIRRNVHEDNYGDENNNDPRCDEWQRSLTDYTKLTLKSKVVTKKTNGRQYNKS